MVLSKSWNETVQLIYFLLLWACLKLMFLSAVWTSWNNRIPEQACNFSVMLLLGFELDYFPCIKNSLKKGLSRMWVDRYYKVNLRLCTSACANNQEYFNSSDTIFSSEEQMYWHFPNACPLYAVVNISRWEKISTWEINSRHRLKLCLRLCRWISCWTL